MTHSLAAMAGAGLASAWASALLLPPVQLARAGRELAQWETAWKSTAAALTCACLAWSGAVWLLLGFVAAHWAAGLLFHMGTDGAGDGRHLARELRLLLLSSPLPEPLPPLLPLPLLWARGSAALRSPLSPLSLSLALCLLLFVCMAALWVWLEHWGRAVAVMAIALLLWPAPLRGALGAPLNALSAALATILFTPETEEEARAAAVAAAKSFAEDERERMERESEGAAAEALQQEEGRAAAKERANAPVVVVIKDKVPPANGYGDAREISTSKALHSTADASDQKQRVDKEKEQEQNRENEGKDCEEEEEEEDLLPRSGVLQKKDPNGPGWRRRHFVVDCDGTVEYSASASSAPLRRLSLATCEEPEAEAQSLRFRVRDRRDGRVYRLQAPSAAARTAWLHSMTRAWRRAHFLAVRAPPPGKPPSATAVYGPPAEETRATATAGGFLRWPGSGDGSEGAWRYCLLSSGRLVVYASPFSQAPLLSLPPPPPPPSPPLLETMEQSHGLRLTSGPECVLHAAEKDEAQSWATAAAAVALASPPLEERSPQTPTKCSGVFAQINDAEPVVTSATTSESPKAESNDSTSTCNPCGAEDASIAVEQRPEHWSAAPDTGRARASTLGSARRPQLSSSAPPLPSPSLTTGAVRPTLHRSMAEGGDNTSGRKAENSVVLAQERSARAWEGEAVLKEGLLVKRGDRVKNWKRRRFVLTGKALLYYAPDGRRPLGEVSLEHCSAARPALAASRPHVFLLPNRRSGREYFMAASGAGEMAAWVAAINAARDGTARAARAERRAPLIAAQSDVSGLRRTAEIGRASRARGWTVARTPSSPPAEEEVALLTLDLGLNSRSSSTDEAEDDEVSYKTERHADFCGSQQHCGGVDSGSSASSGSGDEADASDSDHEEKEEQEEKEVEKEEKKEKAEKREAEEVRSARKENGEKTEFEKEELLQAAAAWRPCLSPRRPRAYTEDTEGTSSESSASPEATRPRGACGSAPVLLSASLPQPPTVPTSSALAPLSSSLPGDREGWRRAQPRLDGFVLKRKKQRTVSAWKRRYFVLHNGVLKIYRSDEDPGIRPPRRAFDMRHVRVEEGGEREHSFLLDVPADGCTYDVAVETAAQLHAWIAALREATAAKQKRCEEELLSWASVRSRDTVPA